jgi:hypothetical protein
MGVSARIAVALFIAVGIYTGASASQALDAASVLFTVAQSTCLRDKPTSHFLNPKVARPNDTAESRAMLSNFFGDLELVNSFFSQNAETAKLPKNGRYACYQLSDYGEVALSIPVFSKSGADSFVIFADNCPALCGRVELYVLHLTGGRWHVSRVIVLAVS